MLRQNHLARKNPTRMYRIAITSGKGGVGKTLSSINMSISLAEFGHAVLLFDGDLGLANVDVVLGVQARYNIKDVLDGLASFSEMLVDGPSGTKIIPSGSGISKLTQLTEVQKTMLAQEISKHNNRFDYLVIDTGAGISDNVIHLNGTADLIVVVTTPEPHALTDAYALIKVVSENYPHKPIFLLANNCLSQEEGLKIFRRLAEVANKFLEVSISYLGYVPKDPQMHHLVMRRNWSANQSLSTLSGQAWAEAARQLISFSQSTVELDKPDDFWTQLFARNSGAYKSALQA